MTEGNSLDWGPPQKMGLRQQMKNSGERSIAAQKKEGAPASHVRWKK
jgi:hypothetical protein